MSAVILVLKVMHFSEPFLCSTISNDHMPYGATLCKWVYFICKRSNLLKFESAYELISKILIQAKNFYFFIFYFQIPKIKSNILGQFLSILMMKRQNKAFFTLCRSVPLGACASMPRFRPSPTRTDRSHFQTARTAVF